MKLTSVYLSPALGEFDANTTDAFRYQTRFLCNYVQRHVAARKVQGDGFNRISVICTSAPKELTYKNTSNVLISEVRIDMDQYEKLAVEHLPEYFIGLLESGLSKCSKDQHVPYEYFENAIHSFRAEGYKDEWIHSEKTFRTAGIKCRLRCKVDLSCFRLVLEIERRGQRIFSQQILETLPDEIIYAYRFKDIKFDGDAAIVQNKFGKPLATISLAGL